MIHFKCSKCGEGMEAPESMAGDVLQCPKCELHERVPNVPPPKPAPETPPPVIVNAQPQIIYPSWNPGIAAVLSFFIPGLGQLYKNQIINGITWFLVVGFAYLFLWGMCLLPGPILHFCCIISAASGHRPQVLHY